MVGYVGKNRLTRVYALAIPRRRHLRYFKEERKRKEKGILRGDYSRIMIVVSYDCSGPRLILLSGPNLRNIRLDSKISGSIVLKRMYDIGNSLIERTSDGKYPFYLNTMLRPLFNCRINVRPNVRSSDQCRLQSPTNGDWFWATISSGEKERRGGGGRGRERKKRKEKEKKGRRVKGGRNERRTG